MCFCLVPTKVTWRENPYLLVSIFTNIINFKEFQSFHSNDWRIVPLILLSSLCVQYGKYKNKSYKTHIIFESVRCQPINIWVKKKGGRANLKSRIRKYIPVVNSAEKNWYWSHRCYELYLNHLLTKQYFNKQRLMTQGKFCYN